MPRCAHRAELSPRKNPQFLHAACPSFGFSPRERAAVGSFREIAPHWVRSAGSCRSGFVPRDPVAMGSFRGNTPERVRSAGSCGNGFGPFLAWQVSLSSLRQPSRSRIHPSSFILSPVPLRCRAFCVICVNSVTALSVKGLRRRFLNDLPLLMRHGRWLRVCGSCRERHDRQKQNNAPQSSGWECRVGSSARGAVRSRRLAARSTSYPARSKRSCQRSRSRCHSCSTFTVAAR